MTSVNFSKNASKAAKMLKALSHPERLLILCHLVGGEQCVGDLWKKSALSQSAFSQHLLVLRKLRLVKTRKKSQTIFYSIADRDAIKMLDTLHKLYCK